MEKSTDIKNQTSEEGPPFFRSWNAWYALVLIFLAVLIILFYWFSISF
jgi:hypothetical protein